MSILASLLILLSEGFLFSQTSVYYKNFVRHTNGDFCYHTPPNASYTAYLNRDQGKALFETAPQWQVGGDPNIAGNGTFGVELGNFANPPVATGDSVFVRFTCLTTAQQGVLSDSIASIPWFHFPQTLFLNPAAFPARPQSLALSTDSSGQRIINWVPQPGVTYSIYRRSVNDTLPNGYARMLYTRIAENIAAGSFTDTTTSSQGFGYVVVPKSGNIFGPHSEEVNDLPPAPEAVGALLFRLNPLQIKISWQSPATGQGVIYRIYRSGSPGVPIIPAHLIGETGDNYFLDFQVTPEQVYYYKIVTVSGSGVVSEPSEETHLRTVKPNVPGGFQIEIYATEDIEHPSGMARGPNGRMFLCEVAGGEVKIAEDINQDGFVDTVKVFATGFEQPVGLAWKGDSLYVSSRGKITIVRDTDGDDVADVYDTIISGWPCFWHQNNQLIFDPEGYFFVALGSWEDRTTGPSQYNNKIMRISPDGSDIQIWAEGIRNVYDMAFSPGTPEYLFGGDNGWQEQTPGGQPEELNYYAEGRHYGYPDYLGFPPPNTGTEAPLAEFPDHTAPTGVMFYTGEQFPAEYRNDLYMAFYGPDNWDPDIFHKAYRIVRCEISDTVLTDTIEFANHFYRPVDMIEDAEGAMYVADLGQFWPPEVDGHIFKITYEGGNDINNEHPVAGRFELYQNYPNPFNPTTTISFSIAKSGPVSLIVYDILGRAVKTLVEEPMTPGVYKINFDARNLPSGIYFYRLTAGDFTQTRKMLLIR